MCEIAILSPSKHSDEELTNAAMELYAAMGSGLGVVSIHETDNKERFEYNIYKRVTPDREAIEGFMADHSDDAVRIIIHGRMATHGGISREHTHPLEMECDACNVDYVLHNGVVHGHRRDRNQLEPNGHNFATEVDSEVIGHVYGDVPTDFENETFYDTQPAYILLNDTSAYIVSSGHYQLTEYGTMALSYRTFGPDRRADNYAEVILTPTNAE